jgi:outer membrane lipoprotein-sorting protein
MRAAVPAGESPISSNRKPCLIRAFVSLAAPALVAALLAFEARPAERAAVSTPEEIRLLNSIQKAYTSAPSFTADFVQTYAPAGFAAAAPETGRVTLEAPDRIRFDYDGPEGKLFTFDGTSARQYVAADRQMIVRTLAPADRERLPLLFFESARSVLERYEAAVASENGLAEVTLTPKTGGDPARILLTVAPSGDVKRLVVTDTAGNRTTFTFSRRTAGPRRPLSDFALKPPAGTRVLAE